MKKTYKVHEIFYTLQGEGFWTGTPVLFIRLSLCNLRCPFCDTDFSGATPLDADQIIAELKKLSAQCKRVVITGGEPAIQVDGELISALHSQGYAIHIETNGTLPLPEGIDWVTVSPKADWCPSATPVLTEADEVKVVFYKADPARWLDYIPQAHHFLQPCSGKNTEEVVTYIKSHPQWRLSLQTHKYLKIK